MTTSSTTFKYNFLDNGLPDDFCPIEYMNLLSQHTLYQDFVQEIIVDATTSKNLEEIEKIAQNYMEHGLNKSHDIDKWVDLSNKVASDITEKIENLHLIQMLLKALLEVPIRAGSLSIEQVYKVIKLPIHRIPEYHNHLLQLC